MQSDLLAESDRAPGFAAFMQAIFEASLPPAELKKVAIPDLNGTEDETLPLRPSMSNRTVMEPYAKKFRVGRIGIRAKSRCAKRIVRRLTTAGGANSRNARMAERVGFAPLPRIETKGLNIFPLPQERPDPLKSQGRDTY